MKKLLIALSLALATTGVYAKEEKKEEKAATPQQTRMADCNKEAGAKELKGDERKAFMKSCLGGKKDDAKAMTPQQEKMANCNKEAKAKEMKGAERKKFMSECLKGNGKPANENAATPASPATPAKK